MFFLSKVAVDFNPTDRHLRAAIFWREDGRQVDVLVEHSTTPLLKKANELPCTLLLKYEASVVIIHKVFILSIVLGFWQNKLTINYKKYLI